MLQYRDFWNVPAEYVIGQTGAASVMDMSDIQEVLDALELSLDDKFVVDVGCGSGRLTQLCQGYKGYDISPGCVEFCRQQGLDAEVIEEATDVATHGDIVTCLSVFTHISQPDREAFLDQFTSCAQLLLVDILPGDDVGGIGAWYTPQKVFEDSLKALYPSWRTYSRVSPDGENHLYYLAHQ